MNGATVRRDSRDEPLSIPWAQSSSAAGCNDIVKLFFESFQTPPVQKENNECEFQIDKKKKGKKYIGRRTKIVGDTRLLSLFNTILEKKK